MDEYAEGMGHEIYRISLSEKMEKRYFSDIARSVFKKTKAIVFAIEVKCNGKTIIRLNPSDFIVNNIKENEIHVYTICPDKRTAESIETIEMNKEERTRYFNMKAQKSKEEKTMHSGNHSDHEERETSHEGYHDMQHHNNEDHNSSQHHMQGHEQFNNDKEDYDLQSEEVRKRELFYMEDVSKEHDKLTKINLEDDPNIRNHIIVCGIHSSIEDFIMPLRSRHLKEYQL